MSSPIITLTTDFGTADPYVAAMKGILLAIAPAAAVVDLSHQIPPQDVRAAARLLARGTAAFPPGTVHLAVVDPGVGSERRPLALSAGGHLWVGPDNGLFSHLLGDEQVAARQITHPLLRRRQLSATFHGRDLFAPAAAHLARGFPFSLVGPPVADPVALDLAAARRTAHSVVGEVEHVDAFGNLVSNVPSAWLAGPGAVLRVRLGATIVAEGISTTYADVPEGSPLALVGSAGTLEVSVRNGSAADSLGLGPGAPVTVEFTEAT